MEEGEVISQTEVFQENTSLNSSFREDRSGRKSRKLQMQLENNYFPFSMCPASSRSEQAYILFNMVSNIWRKRDVLISANIGNI